MKDTNVISRSNMVVSVLSGMLILMTIGYTCLYAIYFVKHTHGSLLSEISSLRSDLTSSLEEVDLLREELQEAQNLLNVVKVKEDKLLDIVYPWERCMRFQFRSKCEPGSGKEDEPPCAVDILGELITVLTQALEEATVSHWISYGTLLGAVRDHKIIPWTTDVDIVVDQKDWKGLAKKLNDRNKLLQKNGFKFFYDKDYPELGRLCITEASPKYAKWVKSTPETTPYYDSGYPYVDFYQAYDKPNDKMMVKFGPPCQFNKSDIYPLTKVELLGRRMNAPNKYNSYLAQIYGPNFMTPPDPKHRHAHGAYSEACKHG